MVIKLEKFGDILVACQDGREAFVKVDENIEVDFTGVRVFSPSWGDKFFRPLFEMFNLDQVVFKNTQNSSVEATLNFLGQLKWVKFKII